MEVLHRVESGFYRLAKVVEEKGEGVHFTPMVSKPGADDQVTV